MSNVVAALLVEKRNVALARAVEEEDVAREVVGAAEGLGAVEDGLDGGEGLIVGEVAAAAHDALFEEPGAGAVALHVGVVVGFECENVDAAEAGDEFIGDVAEIGGEADAVAVAGEEESVGAFGIVGESEGFDLDALHGLEGRGFGEGMDEVFEGAGEAVFGAELFLGVEGFAGVEEAAGVVRGGVEMDALFEEGLKPVGIEVVGIEVGEEDGLQVGEFDAGAGETLRGGAGPESGVDEEGAPGSADEGGVAGRTASEDA